MTAQPALVPSPLRRFSVGYTLALTETMTIGVLVGMLVEGMGKKGEADEKTESYSEADGVTEA